MRQVPIYKVKLVREGTPRVTLNNSTDARAFAKTLLPDDLDRENFWTIMLNTKQKVIGATQVSVGTIDASLVHPREVFKPAIACSAAAIVVDAETGRHTGGADPRRDGLALGPASN